MISLKINRNIKTIIINDCRDQNAAGRQCIRVASILGGNVTFIGAENDISAAGNLVDALDAVGRNPTIVLVNIAPRAVKKWRNGTPFGYFWYKKSLIISSVDGLTLSLVKKLKLIDSINLFSSRSIFKELNIEEEKNTQFRSFELTPRIALALLKGRKLKTKKILITEIPDAPNVVWYADCFGNLKTTIVYDRKIKYLTLKNGKKIKIFPSMKDVPVGQWAAIKGSSGLGHDKRFLEIIIQGGSAAETIGLKVGDPIKI